MVQYTSEVIYQFADRLYQIANRIVWSYTLAGILVGLLVGYAGMGALRTDGTSTYAAVILALLFGALGYSVGTQKAFDLKLRAQSALCNVKIEENTRQD